MSAFLQVAVAASRSWTALYTGGLDEMQRSARRAEIESDLWEHQESARIEGEPPVDTGFEIVTRLLLGIPSDLSWRHTTTGVDRSARDRRTGVRPMFNRLFVAIATVLTLFVGILFVYMGIGRGFSGAGLQGVAVLPAAAGLAMIVGVVVTTRSGRIGTALVAAGAITIVFMFPWMIAITLSLALVIIFGSLARGRSLHNRVQPA